MSSTVRLSVEGVAAMYDALQEFEDGLERVLVGELVAVAEHAVPRARALAGRGPGPRADARNPNDRLPHIGDTIYATPAGRAAAIVAAHPAGGLLEYGGTIQPRGHASQRISFRARAMAHRAVDEQVEAAERDLEARLDRLAARVGL